MFGPLAVRSHGQRRKGRVPLNNELPPGFSGVCTVSPRISRVAQRALDGLAQSLGVTPYQLYARILEEAAVSPEVTKRRLEGHSDPYAEQLRALDSRLDRLASLLGSQLERSQAEHEALMAMASSTNKALSALLPDSE